MKQFISLADPQSAYVAMYLQWKYSQPITDDFTASIDIPDRQ